ncbi:MAG: hypothetical protein NZM42_05935 [Gemmatales bacterium]|nr:hypothetical protein [Gemmatales bacterium]MDW8223514.1 hypothetical protein [Gemmatales bacterium]
MRLDKRASWVGLALVAVVVPWTLVLPCSLANQQQDSTKIRRVSPVPHGLRESWRLSDFYEKCVLADGLPIVASRRVNDYALLEAAYIVDQMLAGRDDIRQAIVKSRIRVVVMAYNERTTDVPEHADLRPADYWDRRARGLGATRIRPAISCGEENLLEYPGDPYRGENILVHEFAHTIHQIGMREVDKTFDRRLREAYDSAMKAGLWKGTYAATNPSEYWAEGVQAWFHCNRTHDRQHNHVNDRDTLRRYDAALAKLMEEVFGQNNWLYIPPSRRPKPAHLEGFDRSKVPTFRWTERFTPKPSEDKPKPPTEPDKTKGDEVRRSAGHAAGGNHCRYPKAHSASPS